MQISLLFPLVLALSAPAAANDDPPAAAPVASTAAIDPVTGRLRALTPEEAEALARDAERLDRARALQRGARSGPSRPANEAEAGLTETRRADGTVMRQVPESLDSQATVRRTADGRLVLGHGSADETDGEAGHD